MSLVILYFNEDIEPWSKPNPKVKVFDIALPKSMMILITMVNVLFDINY